MWQLPWRGKTPYQIRRSLLDGVRPEVPDREALPGPEPPPAAALDGYQALMRECWAQAPEQRPTFAAIVSRLSALL